MFCANCGSCGDGKFCTTCGNELSQSITSPAQPLKFNEFLRQKGKERVRKKPNQTNKSKATEEQQATIYSSILKYDVLGEKFKQDRGSRLPVIVDINWGPWRLKQAIFERFRRYKIISEEDKIWDYNLSYKNGDKIENLPGTNIPFTVKAFKQDLGIGYHSVSVYLLKYETDSDDDNASGNDDNDHRESVQTRLAFNFVQY